MRLSVYSKLLASPEGRPGKQIPRADLRCVALTLVLVKYRLGQLKVMECLPACPISIQQSPTASVSHEGTCTHTQ